MNVIKKEKVVKNQYYPPPTSRCEVYNATRSSSGSIQYQKTEGTKKNSRFLQTVGFGILEGVLCTGSTAGTIAAFAGTAAVTGPAAPFVIAGGAIGFGIGALFGLFN